MHKITGLLKREMKSLTVCFAAYVGFVSLLLYSVGFELYRTGRDELEYCLYVV